MALMKFREANQVKWNGSRPGHDGTQKLAQASADAATVPIYTVLAGETLYLCSVTMGVLTDVAGEFHTIIRNDAAAAQFFPTMGIRAAGSAPCHYVCTFWPPAELIEDWDVIVYSNTAGLTVYGSIFGWIE